VASEELDRQVKKEVHAFREALCRETGSGGVISLEFYQKRRLRWPMPAETTPWEVWNIKINVVSLPNEHGLDFICLIFGAVRCLTEAVKYRLLL
jgi:autophagy-related protein 101